MLFFLSGRRKLFELVWMRKNPWEWLWKQCENFWRYLRLVKLFWAAKSLFLCRVWEYMMMMNWKVESLNGCQLLCELQWIWKLIKDSGKYLWWMRKFVKVSQTHDKWILWYCWFSLSLLSSLSCCSKCELSHELHIVLLLFLRKNQQSEWSE